MKCPVCSGEEWKNVDKFRLKAHDMCMCTSCGFVSYPSKYKTKEEIMAYYRNDYRKPPNVSNLYTGERKLHYHEAFMGETFAKWKSEGKKPLVGEVGAAYGVFLNWLKTHHFPDGEFYGTELTTTYRRVAFHEYGILLTEDLPDKKYDLICSYHVLEHQQEPDVELKRYASMLKDDGLFYLSTPIWFREATNFGANGFDIEYYWHPDHINCWSEVHLEAIIEKAGLEVIQKNDDIYGNTYLLRKKTADDKPKEFAFDPSKNVEIIERLFRCWRALTEGETAQSIEAYPNCVTAWINHYETNRGQLHKEGFEVIHKEILQKAVKSCPNQAEALTFAGDVCARYDKYDLALSYLSKALNRKPNNPTILMTMGNCFRQLALKETDKEKKIAYLKEAMDIGRFVRQTSLEVAGQATTFVYNDAAQIPFEGE